MNLAKKLEKDIQNKTTSMDDEGKNKEICIYDDGFLNLINNQNISKIKKKLYFLIIKNWKIFIYLK